MRTTYSARQTIPFFFTFSKLSSPTITAGRLNTKSNVSGFPRATRIICHKMNPFLAMMSTKFVFLSGEDIRHSTCTKSTSKAEKSMASKIPGSEPFFTNGENRKIRRKCSRVVKKKKCVRDRKINCHHLLQPKSKC